MVETAVDDDEIMGDKIGAKSRDDESFRKPPSVNYRAGNYYRVCPRGANGRTDGSVART